MAAMSRARGALSMSTSSRRMASGFSAAISSTSRPPSVEYRFSG
jgi:hypothetical protein